MAEGEFPKSDGDAFYASEVNGILNHTQYFINDGIAAINSGTGFQAIAGFSGAIVAPTVPNAISILSFQFSTVMDVDVADMGGASQPFTILLDGGSEVIPTLYDAAGIALTDSRTAISTGWVGSVSAGSHTFTAALENSSAGGASLRFNTTSTRVSPGTMIVSSYISHFGSIIT